MQSNFARKITGLTLAALAGLGALVLGLKIAGGIAVEPNKDNAFDTGWVAATVRLARGE
jgi:hypothetical protein